MKYLGSKTIETDRLILKAQTMAEQQYLWSVLMQPDVNRYYLTVPKKFAEKLKKGDVIVLTGELGSGKTKFTEGVLEHFGLENEISSPTFNIVNVRNRCVHFFCQHLWIHIFNIKSF